MKKHPSKLVMDDLVAARFKHEAFLAGVGLLTVHLASFDVTLIRQWHDCIVKIFGKNDAMSSSYLQG